MPKPQKVGGSSATTDSPVKFSNAIVTTRQRRVEVIASPGSGKTHTLIRRVLWLLEQGVAAEKIAVLSFSNSTVAELKLRLANVAATDTGGKESNTGEAESDSELSSQLKRVSVTTAHAYALGLARRVKSGTASGARYKGNIVADKTQHALIVRAIKRVIKKAINEEIWLKASNLVRKRQLELAEHLAKAQAAPEIARLFGVVAASRKSLPDVVAGSGFDALRTLEGAVSDVRPAIGESKSATNRLVKVLLEVAKQYAAVKRGRKCIDYGDMLSLAIDQVESDSTHVKHTHFLVDEFQDCSAAQVALLARLAALPNRQIMVFGDPSQAVYGFMGAAYVSLSSELDSVIRMRLPVSVRLTAEVAALASAVVNARGNNRIATAKSGARPVLIELASTSALRDAVVLDVQRLVDQGVALSDIAVLARTKAQLYEIEAALLAAKIDTNRLGKNRRHLHVRNVLRFVRLIERHASQAVGTKQRIEAKAIESLLAKAAGRANIEPAGASIKQAIVEVRIASRSSSLAGRYQGCVRAYLKLLGGSRENKEIQHELARWEPLCSEHNSSKAMREALKTMPTEKVVTATIHAAKGREWKHVRVVGVTEGLLPIYHAKEESAIREEMKLMYVAVTRAIDTLKLYHAVAPHTRSGKTFDKLSRFVANADVLKRLNHVPVTDNKRSRCD